MAHARHLAEEFSLTGEYSLKIDWFRRKTYRASYSEPRVQARNVLLRSSYESALEQAQKANIDTAKTFFFLEDTSVEIDALSHSGEKIPGVDVKYWMKDRSFKSLDELLKEQGDNRKVTVQSDMLLHVPEYYRPRWGSDEPYIVFSGHQEGTVAQREYSFETNAVFPWLDNKTFNKWFVPNGESVPISLLPIKQANRYDFRRHAFAKMVDFLLRQGAIPKNQIQTSLGLEISPTLIVCGFTCAGKTTISQYLIREYGYMHIEASDFMYLNYYLRHDINSEIDISAFAERALIEKPEIAAKQIAEYIEAINEPPIVISGFRSIEEIEWLKKFFDNNKTFEVIFIEAKESIRHERFNARKRYGARLSLEDFKANDKQQERMGLNEISASRACKTIRNEGDFNDFYSAFTKAAKPTAKAVPRWEFDYDQFQEFSLPLKLEDSIFITLLSKWKNDEDRKFYTTTEIAKMIADLFPAIERPKHKDNVSRYFNQDFYAFYEIECVDENIRKYRLSNTGYGRALEVYFKLARQVTP